MTILTARFALSVDDAVLDDAGAALARGTALRARFRFQACLLAISHRSSASSSSATAETVTVVEPCPWQLGRLRVRVCLEGLQGHVLAYADGERAAGAARDDELRRGADVQAAELLAALWQRELR